MSVNDLIVVHLGVYKGPSQQEDSFFNILQPESSASAR